MAKNGRRFHEIDFQRNHIITQESTKSIHNIANHQVSLDCVTRLNSSEKLSFFLHKGAIILGFLILSVGLSVVVIATVSDCIRRPTCRAMVRDPTSEFKGLCPKKHVPCKAKIISFRAPNETRTTKGVPGSIQTLEKVT